MTGEYADNIDWAIARNKAVHEMAKAMGIEEMIPTFKSGFSLDANLITSLISYGVDVTNRAQMNAMLGMFRVIMDAVIENGVESEAVLGVLFDALATEAAR